MEEAFLPSGALSEANKCLPPKHLQSSGASERLVSWTDRYPLP